MSSTGTSLRRLAVAFTAVAVLATGFLALDNGSELAEARGTRESAADAAAALTQGLSPRPAEGPAEAAAADLGRPVITRIPDKQWRRIVRTGTWRANCPVDRKDLRRLEINYVGFAGKAKRGVVVAHRDSIADIALVLGQLYGQGFPIRQMRPVERFGGDVDVSLRANNTSAYNCRKPDQLNASMKDSPHANGRAIDINPDQNPWRDPRCRCWSPSGANARTKAGAGVIRKGSVPVQLFTSQGWIWQNIKVPDYMHFDTGFPSRPPDRSGTN